MLINPLRHPNSAKYQWAVVGDLLHLKAILCGESCRRTEGTKPLCTCTRSCAREPRCMQRLQCSNQSPDQGRVWEAICIEHLPDTRRGNFPRVRVCQGSHSPNQLVEVRAICEVQPERQANEEESSLHVREAVKGRALRGPYLPGHPDGALVEGSRPQRPVVRQVQVLGRNNHFHLEAQDDLPEILCLGVAGGPLDEVVAQHRACKVIQGVAASYMIPRRVLDEEPHAIHPALSCHHLGREHLPDHCCNRLPRLEPPPAPLVERGPAGPHARSLFARRSNFWRLGSSWHVADCWRISNCWRRA
mmetsp:Transcript_53610/g.124868  ORF Transcript_53610/g.124868 Transcript_53610/m.124868 type:complete len:303 (-) Transcript_53610:151-1059(-)